MIHLSQRSQVDGLLKPKPLPFFPPTHSNFPQLNKKRVGNFLVSLWLYFFPAKPLENCLFWAKMCTELGLAPRPKEQSRKSLLHFVEEGEARRMQKSRAQKQQPLCSLRQIPGFFPRFEPDLTLHSPRAPSTLAKSWSSSRRHQPADFHWSCRGRGQSQFTTYLAGLGL